MRRRRATVATPGEWQCKIRTGGVRRLAVANGPNIFQMLLVYKCFRLSKRRVTKLINISVYLPLSTYRHHYWRLLSLGLLAAVADWPIAAGRPIGQCIN